MPALLSRRPLAENVTALASAINRPRGRAEYVWDRRSSAARDLIYGGTLCPCGSMATSACLKSSAGVSDADVWATDNDWVGAEFAAQQADLPATADLLCEWKKL